MVFSFPRRLFMRELSGKRVGVLLGGTSSEREVSIKSGKAVAQALRRRGYSVEEIDASGDLWHKLDRIDVACVVLHGKPGEDGTVQGLLELKGVPYTGPGVLGAACAMNKLVSKKILAYHGVRTPRFRVYRRDGVVLEGEDSLPEGLYPVVVKPVDEGSTIGVSVARSESELEDALRKAFELSSEVLVEEFIEGRELTVGVVGDRPLAVVEIRPKKGFYDYESKYTKGMTEYLVPAPIPEEIEALAKRWALVAHRALYQRGVSRSDFRLSLDGELYYLETNSIPGLTETSLLPKAAGHEGISFDELAELILMSAFEGGMEHEEGPA